MKKLIVCLILLASLTQAQSVMLLFGSDGVASIDTIPSQFTFTDVTDAAVSSYNQAYFIVAGCDSARFYPASGDSLKLGVLGTYDVDPIWADVGDSIYVPNVASASNSTATHSIIYSSDGTPLDTFTVTTVAASVPSYTTDSLRLYWDDSDLSNGSVGTWTAYSGYTGNLTNLTDTTQRAIMTSGGLVFDGTNDWYRLAVPSGLGDSQLSLELVLSISDSTTEGQRIAGVRNLDSGGHVLNIRLSGSRIATYGYDGANVTDRYMDVYSTPIIGTMAHLVVTWDGSGTESPNVYINGALVGEVGTSYLGGGGDGDNIFLGGDNGTTVIPAGSIIRLFRIYELELTAQQVEDNYNSSSVQDKLP